MSLTEIKGTTLGTKMGVTSTTPVVTIGASVGTGTKTSTSSIGASIGTGGVKTQAASILPTPTSIASNLPVIGDIIKFGTVAATLGANAAFTGTIVPQTPTVVTPPSSQAAQQTSAATRSGLEQKYASTSIAATNYKQGVNLFSNSTLAQKTDAMLNALNVGWQSAKVGGGDSGIPKQFDLSKGNEAYFNALPLYTAGVAKTSQSRANTLNDIITPYQQGTQAGITAQSNLSGLTGMYNDLLDKYNTAVASQDTGFNWGQLALYGLLGILGIIALSVWLKRK
jgi:hypothetical protein